MFTNTSSIKTHTEISCLHPQHAGARMVSTTSTESYGWVCGLICLLLELCLAGPWFSSVPRKQNSSLCIWEAMNAPNPLPTPFPPPNYSQEYFAHKSSACGKHPKPHIWSCPHWLLDLFAWPFNMGLRNHSDSWPFESPWLLLQAQGSSLWCLSQVLSWIYLLCLPKSPLAGLGKVISIRYYCVSIVGLGYGAPWAHGSLPPAWGSGHQHHCNTTCSLLPE